MITWTPNTRDEALEGLERVCERLNLTDPEATTSLIVTLQAMRARQQASGYCPDCGQKLDLTPDGAIPEHKRDVSASLPGARVKCAGSGKGARKPPELRSVAA